MGNVGTFIGFRVGLTDAKLLSKELGEVISREDLMGLSNWNVYLRLLINGNVSAPFNTRTLLPDKPEHKTTVEEIRRVSRRRYDRPRAEVEDEIRRAWLSVDV